MSIGLGVTVKINAHYSGSATVIDKIEWVPTMVDTTAVTGKLGATNAQSDFIVEKVDVNNNTLANYVTDGSNDLAADSFNHHAWVIKLVYAEAFIPATSASIANYITYCETALDAFKTGEKTT